ncbi:hypothetical protein [Erwinia pyrifoliae]
MFYLSGLLLHVIGFG